MGLVLLGLAVLAYVGWPLRDPCALVDVGGPMTAAQQAAYEARCAPVRPTAGWVGPSLLALFGLLVAGLGLVRPTA